MIFEWNSAHNRSIESSILTLCKKYGREVDVKPVHSPHRSLSYIWSGNLVWIYDQISNNNMDLRVPAARDQIIVLYAEHILTLSVT